MVAITIAVKKPRGETENYSNETLIDLCKFKVGFKKKKGHSSMKQQIADHPEWSLVSQTTMYKYCEKNSVTGLYKFEELEMEGLNAPSLERRLRGGKASNLTDEFLFRLFTMICVLGFSECPMSSADIKNVIRIELKRVEATYGKGKKKRGETGKLTETTYEDDHEYNDLYRSALRRFECLDLKLKVRPSYTIAMSRVLAQEGSKMENWIAAVNHRVETLAEAQYITNGTFMGPECLLNQDEFQAQMYNLNGEMVVVPANCKVQVTIPKERMQHITCCGSINHDRYWAFTTIVPKGSLKDEEVEYTVQKLTFDGDRGRYSASSNGWMVPDLKVASMIDLVKHIEAAPEFEGKSLLMFCDGHYTNLIPRVAEIFRNRGHGYMVFPSHLTNHLQPMDASRGAISLFTKILQTNARNDYFRQKLLDHKVFDASLRELMEQSLIEFRNSDACRKGCRESWTKTGWVFLTEYEAVRRWHETDPYKRPLVPIRLIYNPLGVSSIAQAFKSSEKGSNGTLLQKALVNVPQSIQNDMQSTFTVYRDQKREEKARGFQSVSADGCDFTMSGSADSEAIKRKKNNADVEERKKQRKKLKHARIPLLKAVSVADVLVKSCEKTLNAMNSSIDGVRRIHETVNNWEVLASVLTANKIPVPGVVINHTSSSRLLVPVTEDSLHSLQTVCSAIGAYDISAQKQVTKLVMNELFRPKNTVVKTTNDYLALARLIEGSEDLQKIKLKADLIKQLSNEINLKSLKWTSSSLQNFTAKCNGLEIELNGAIAARKRAESELSQFQATNGDLLTFDDEKDVKQRMMTDAEVQETNNAAFQEETLKRAKEVLEREEKLYYFSNKLREDHPDIFPEKENGNMFRYSDFVRAVGNNRHFKELRFNALEMGPEEIHAQEEYDARLLVERQNREYMHEEMNAYEGNAFPEYDDWMNLDNM